MKPLNCNEKKKIEMAYVEMKADAKNINRLFVRLGKSNPFFFQNVLIFPVVFILIFFVTLSFKRIDFRTRM